MQLKKVLIILSQIPPEYIDKINYKSHFEESEEASEGPHADILQ